MASRNRCPCIWDGLTCLLIAVSSPWRRVSPLSVTESGRLSAVAADSKLEDSLGDPNRHFGVREPRVGSSGERDEKGDTGPRWESPWGLLSRRSNGGRWPGGRKNLNMGIIRSPGNRVPASVRNKSWGSAGGGPCCRRTATSLFMYSLLSQYHILIHCLDMEVVALKRQNQFEYLTLTAREDVCVKNDKLMSVAATREQQSRSHCKQHLKTELLRQIIYIGCFQKIVGCLYVCYPPPWTFTILDLE